MWIPTLIPSQTEPQFSSPLVGSIPRSTPRKCRTPAARIGESSEAQARPGRTGEQRDDRMTREDLRHCAMLCGLIVLNTLVCMALSIGAAAFSKPQHFVRKATSGADPSLRGFHARTVK